MRFKRTAGDKLYVDDVNQLEQAARKLDRVGGATAHINGLTIPSGVKTPLTKWPSVICRGDNGGGNNYTIPMYGVMTIGGVYGDYVSGINNRAVLLNPPAAGDKIFAVALEQITPGAIGNVAVMGLAWVLMQNPNAYKFASLTPAQNYLTGSATGPAEIISEDTGGATTHMALIRFGPGGSGASGVQQLKIVAQYDDYLACYPWDDVQGLGTTLVNVAKPWLLRRAPFDGTSGRNGITYAYSNAYTRVATKGTSTETEVITPSYQPNDVIYAVSGATGFNFSVTIGGIATPMQAVDQNADGRTWQTQG